MADNNMEMKDDKAAREAAIQDIDKSYIVTAPAGSGKTRLMTERILNILAHDEGLMKPEEIVAISFTNKAADELRVRLLKALDDDDKPSDKVDLELAKQALARNKEKGWKLREMPERLRVSTIDSFFAKVLREYAQSSELGTVPTIAADDVERKAIYREAALTTLDYERLEENDEQGRETIRAFLDLFSNRKQAAIDALIELFETREQWMKAFIEKDADGKYTVRENFLTDNIARLSNLCKFFVDKNFNDFLSTVEKNQCLPELLDLPTKIDDDYEKKELYKVFDSLPSGATTETLRKSDIKTKIELMTAWQDFLLTKDGKYRKIIAGFTKKNPDRACREEFVEKCRNCEKCEAFINTKKLAKLNEAVAIPDDPKHVEWKALEALVRILPSALEELDALWIKYGKLDFIGIAEAAIDILQKMTADNGIRHLIIDEFQDSSQRQYDMISAITKNWNSSDGRTVVVVGDPMQSIYRFREADVSLFINAIETKTIARGGKKPFEFDEVLRLTKNFRSTKELVTRFNEKFSGIFGNEYDKMTGAVKYTEAVSDNKKQGGGADDFEVKPEWKEGNSVGQVVDEVMTFLAETERCEEKKCCAIATALKETTAPTERCEEKKCCAILVPKRTCLSTILYELRKEKISYQAVEIDDLNQRQVITDLSALTSALLHIEDSVSWLAVLRAPWCGLTLDELAAYAPQYVETDENGQSSEKKVYVSVWEKVCNAVNDATAPARVKRVHGILAPAVKDAYITSRFARLVERVWVRLGGPACLNDSGDTEAARLYFDLLSGMERDGTARDNDALANKLEKIKAPARIDPEAARVQVMTVHKAKGLEFDTVILPAGDKSVAGRNNDPSILVRANGKTPDPDDMVFACSKIPVSMFGDAETDKNGKVKYKVKSFIESWLETPREENEYKRLFYVAATRAKRKLIITYKPYKKTPNIDSWCGMLGEQKPEEQKAESPDSTDKTEKITRLPEDWAFTPDAQEGAALPVANGMENDEVTERENAEIVTQEETEKVDETAAAENAHDRAIVGKIAAYSVAIAAGVVTHAFLEEYAKAGNGSDTKAPSDDDIKLRLQQESVYHEAGLDDGVEKVRDAIRDTIEKHPEMLSRHDEDFYELPLTTVEDGMFKNYIIDRLWRSGDEWIIVDYKTTDLKSKGQKELTESVRKKLIDKIETSKYDRQLMNYGKLVVKRFGADPKKVRQYLYFPLMNVIAAVTADGTTIVDQIV